MQFVLPLAPTYRFEAMIDAHGWRMLKPFAWDGESGTLQRTHLLTTGKVVQFAATSSGTTLDLTLEGPDLLPSERDEVEQAIRWMLELDEDFGEFYTYCREYPALQHIPTLGLGPMLRGATVWEDYVKTVCTTNTTWAQTISMVGRLVDAFGTPLNADGPHAFPTPAQVAAVSPEIFADTVRAGYRAPYLYATACEIAGGSLDLERFKTRAREVETTQLMVELRKLRGIGPYAAAHIALLLGSYGHIPVDSWARTLMQRHIRGGEPVTDQEVHAHFAHFGRWRALAFRCWDWDGSATGSQ